MRVIGGEIVLSHHKIVHKVSRRANISQHAIRKGLKWCHDDDFSLYEAISLLSFKFSCLKSISIKMCLIVVVIFIINVVMLNSYAYSNETKEATDQLKHWLVLFPRVLIFAQLSIIRVLYTISSMYKVLLQSVWNINSKFNPWSNSLKILFASAEFSYCGETCNYDTW